MIYVSRKKYSIPYDISTEFIELNVLPYVSILDLGEEECNNAVNMLGQYGLKLSDALHLGAMVSNNITLDNK